MYGKIINKRTHFLLRILDASFILFYRSSLLKKVCQYGYYSNWGGKTLLEDTGGCYLYICRTMPRLNEGRLQFWDSSILGNSHVCTYKVSHRIFCWGGKTILKILEVVNAVRRTMPRLNETLNSCQ